MKNYRNFFTEAKILTTEQFDLISNYCIFDIKLPSRSNLKMMILINATKNIPIDIFASLKTFELTNTNLEIKIQYDNLYSDDNKAIEYINYFANNIYENKDIASILAMEKISILNKLVTLKYFTDYEKRLLQDCLFSLKSFLKANGFAEMDFEITLDITRQARIVTLEKIKREEMDKAKVAKSSITKFTNKEKANVIKGKFTPLCEVNNDSIGNHNVSGEIFSVEKKVTKNNIIIFKFSIYDFKCGALSMVALISDKFAIHSKANNLSEPYLDSFKEGDWINANVNVQVDKYSSYAPVGKILKISHSTKPNEFIFVDDAKDKRIELLCHSKMTAFDGMASASEYISFAKKNNYQTIAVVDRYGVQSFPDIMSSTKNSNIKPIYGSEFEMVDDVIAIVQNPIDQNLEDATYIIFDIETTGLRPAYDDIIEFGAIKVKQGRILEQKQFFIKPDRKLSSKISTLTNITPDMLKDSIDQKQGVMEIKDWIDNDSVLVAHNGIGFDLKFINKKLELYGIERINNCIIDTMQVSRSINTYLLQHTLGKLARFYKIFYNVDEAHRADADARFLYEIWCKMLEVLSLNNITNINQMNEKLQNENLNAAQFGNFVDIYVKNQAGIRDLYTLVSHSLTEGLYQNNRNYGRPKIKRSLIERNRQNLIIVSHPTEGEIWNSYMYDCHEEFNAKIKFYDWIFVSPIQSVSYEIAKGDAKVSDIEATIKEIVAMAAKNSIKVSAVSDAYYIEKWDKILYEICVNIKQLNGKRHRYFTRGTNEQNIPSKHILSTKEMINSFSFLEDDKLINEIVVKSTQKFVDNIESGIKPLKSSLFAPELGDTKKQLTDLVYKNANKIFGNNIDKKIADRIEKELDAIIKNNYDVIYWISHLLVKKSLDDGYLVGSRGSVGSSLVAFLSNISEVNPLPPHSICPNCKKMKWADPTKIDDGFDIPNEKCDICNNDLINDGHNIPFETFLGFKGEKIPDIDLNFSGEYQPIAHNFIKEMFGEKNTFRAGTISTAANKTAYGYVKNYLDENESKDFSNAYIDYLAKRCTYIKRTTGQHPGGIIVVPTSCDINDFTPYGHPADDKTAWYTTHFAFENIHDNLLKFDILGHDDPTSLKMLFKTTGVDPLTIPFSDNKVIEQFNSSNSLGIVDEEYNKDQIGALAIPEFGTQFVRGMLKKTKPKNFSDLIKISGLSHGTMVWQDNAEFLISKASMTLNDVVSCRDDIMVNLIQKNVDETIAFSIMEDVRKGRGIKQEHEEVLKSNKIEQWYIDSCKKIKYLFPKAHATAYVIMAWRIAWYKIYYPLHFYAAYFTIRLDNFDLTTLLKGKEEILSEMNKIKNLLSGQDKSVITVKQKDLYENIYLVMLELLARGCKVSNININKSDATRFIVEDEYIIPPFNCIDGLGNEVALSIIKAREEKAFKTIDDFIDRTKINKAQLKKLNDLDVLSALESEEQLKLF